MKQVIDFFPILVFAAVFYFYRDMILVTKALIAATILQVALSWLIWKKVEKVHLITLAVVIVLGGATVFFHDENFVKWKPTAIYWIFACALLGSQFIGEKNIIQRLLGALLDKMSEEKNKENTSLQFHPSETVPNSLWLKLNIAWIIFFSALGLVNIYIAQNFDNETWVSFKIFGVTIANFIFFLAQIPFLLKYLPNDDEEVASSENLD